MTPKLNNVMQASFFPNEINLFCYEQICEFMDVVDIVLFFAKQIIFASRLLDSILEWKLEFSIYSQNLLDYIKSYLSHRIIDSFPRIRQTGINFLIIVYYPWKIE